MLTHPRPQYGAKRNGSLDPLRVLDHTHSLCSVAAPKLIQPASLCRARVAGKKATAMSRTVLSEFRLQIWLTVEKSYEPALSLSVERIVRLLPTRNYKRPRYQTSFSPN